MRGLALTLLARARAAALPAPAPSPPQPRSPVSMSPVSTGGAHKRRGHETETLGAAGLEEGEGESSGGSSREGGAADSAELLQSVREPPPTVSGIAPEGGLEYSYWVTRMVLRRALGLLLVFAFLTSAFQNRALLGERGLEPRRPGARPTPAFDVLGFGDLQLDLVAWAGVVGSLVLVSCSGSSAVLVGGLWALYLSLVNLESSFIMHYGWEWQILETTFLAIFLYSPAAPPPKVVIWLFRWLAFRCMLGAGLSKVNASPCWREFTCTTTHYETQPNPNPVAWLMHRLPLPLHWLEVLLTHASELVLCWTFLVPHRRVQIAGACAQIAFQACIIATGNYAYINWITLVPFLASFDDAFLLSFCGPAAEMQVARAVEQSRQRAGGVRGRVRAAVLATLACFIAFKSLDPVRELTQRQPWLHFYDDYFFVNAYGVFGFINQQRLELVLEYTHSDPSKGPWAPLDFRCLPGSLARAPCQITPYHRRLDWVTWIETTATLESSYGASLIRTGRYVPHVVRQLCMKILAGDTDAGGLMGVPLDELYGPALDSPPTAIRASLYQYHFSTTFDLLHRGEWWRRTPVEALGGRSVPHVTITDAWPADEVSHVAPEHDWLVFMGAIGLWVSLHSLSELWQRRNPPIMPRSRALLPSKLAPKLAAAVAGFAPCVRGEACLMYDWGAALCSLPYWLGFIALVEAQWYSAAALACGVQLCGAVGAGGYTLAVRGGASGTLIVNGGLAVASFALLWACINR